MQEEIVYSFSRLQAFHNCQMGYYLTYIKRYRDDDNNIYGELGGVVHKLEEDLLNKKITKEEALAIFEEKVEDCLIVGMEFATENSGEKYVESIRRYFQEYEPFNLEDCETEKEFLIDIDGIKIRGFIDLYYKDKEGYIHVVDHKTSSKYSKKDLPKYGRQLILYAYALEETKVGEVKSTAWNFIKYSAKPWRKTITLKERCELSDLESYDRAMVYYPYNEETKQEMIDYVKNTVKEIELKDVNNEYEWLPLENHRGNFFCKTLCEHYKSKRCIYHTY